MFETFQMKKFCLAKQAVLSAFANGLMTAQVCSSGFMNSYTVPIFEGFALRHNFIENKVGGRAITQHLVNLLNDDGITSQAVESSWRGIIDDMKKEVCYLALDAEKEMEAAKYSNDYYKSFTLPDGQIVQVNTPRFMGPEALFKPNLIRPTDAQGIHEMVYSSIQSLESDVRLEFFGNIIPQGAGTLFPNFPQRLYLELRKYCDAKNCTHKINICETDNRYSQVWHGGAVLADLDSFDSQWITKEEYDEYGAEIVHSKCP